MIIYLRNYFKRQRLFTMYIIILTNVLYFRLTVKFTIFIINNKYIISLYPVFNNKMLKKKMHFSCNFYCKGLSPYISSRTRIIHFSLILFTIHPGGFAQNSCSNRLISQPISTSRRTQIISSLKGNSE